MFLWLFLLWLRIWIHGKNCFDARLFFWVLSTLGIKIFSALLDLYLQISWNPSIYFRWLTWCFFRAVFVLLFWRRSLSRPGLICSFHRFKLYLLFVALSLTFFLALSLSFSLSLSKGSPLNANLWTFSSLFFYYISGKQLL